MEPNESYKEGYKHGFKNGETWGQFRVEEEREKVINEVLALFDKHLEEWHSGGFWRNKVAARGEKQ